MVHTSRWIQTIKNGDTIKPWGDRKPLLNAYDIFKISGIKLNDISNQSNDFDGIFKAVKDYQITPDPHNPNKNDKISKDMKRTSQFKYIKMIAPEAIKTDEYKRCGTCFRHLATRRYCTPYFSQQVLILLVVLILSFASIWMLFHACLGSMALHVFILLKVASKRLTR